MKKAPRKSIGWKTHRLFAAIPSLLLLSAIQPACARLVPSLLNFDGTNPETLPAKLSQTGLYDNVASRARAVTAGIVAFEVNTPLWSDGAHKERFITVPAGFKVTPTDSDQYQFPDQTVLIKNFQIDSVYGDSTTRFFIETRFLVIRQSQFGYQYLGVSYKWYRDQTDAELVSQTSGLDTVHQVKFAGAAKGKRWRYPSQADCGACHFNRGVLGFLTPQLNRPSKANPGINQLQALVTANILTANPLAGKAGPTFRWVGLTETGVTPPSGISLVEWKARSYFAANCSQCHGNNHANTFESASHDFDFLHPGRRITYTEPDTIGGFVGKHTNVDPNFPQLIYRGFPESSFVMERMMSRPTAFNTLSRQMPPLATFQMDSAAANVVKDWICSLGSRGSACKLPAVQTDSTYWATGLYHYMFPRSRPGALNAYFHGNRLTVSGPITANPTLSDFQGRAVKMVKLGGGNYLIASPLRSGIYLLKVGSVTAKVNYSP